MVEPEGDVVVIGEITGVYGVRGWVKIYSWCRPPVGILEYQPWLVGQPAGQMGKWQQYEVVTGRPQGKTIVVHLKGIEDRDQARALVGCQIAVNLEQLPPLPKGEYYWAQLTGLQVVNLEGVPLGTVKKLMETGANDVLVVSQKINGDEAGRGSGEVERLIPYIPDVVREVDLPGKRLVIDWDPEF